MPNTAEAVKILLATARSNGYAMSTCGNGCVYAFTRAFLRQMLANGNEFKGISDATGRSHVFSLVEIRALLADPDGADLALTFVPSAKPAVC